MIRYAGLGDIVVWRVEANGVTVTTSREWGAIENLGALLRVLERWLRCFLPNRCEVAPDTVRRIRARRV